MRSRGSATLPGLATVLIDAIQWGRNSRGRSIASAPFSFYEFSVATGAEPSRDGPSGLSKSSSRGNNVIDAMNAIRIERLVNSPK